jgi:uncharacterized protein YdeI (YjbR/CyaY-like superfamily)
MMSNGETHPPMQKAHPAFFETPAAFRAWLAKNHATKKELLVGFYKVGSGKPSMTWPESVDEALAFGWIDGIRRSLGEEAYTIRFSPRKATSIWSAVNIARVAELTKQGRMSAAGLAAFAARDEKRSAIYSYERKNAELESSRLERLRADAKAWAFYSAQAPWYRRTSAHWVTSAKREATREARLKTLIECSRKGVRIPPLAWPAATK